MEAGETATSASRAPLLPVGPARPHRLAVLLGRASGRRGPSLLVREAAALHLEERRADWAYSRPVVALDVAWNLSFAVAAAAVLVASLGERPTVPLRLWVAGYALQCVLHVSLVRVEYRQRRGDGRWGLDGGGGGGRGASWSSDSDVADGEQGTDDVGVARRRRSSFSRQCESINTVVSFLWWIVGFYWTVSGGEPLMQSAPRLYWLVVVFLAFDVFFAMFCLALACMIGIALCCCLPCIIAILYAVAGQMGASDADLSMIPRYRYSKHCTDGQKVIEEAGMMIPIGDRDGSSSSQRVLPHEDAECCICLGSYDDGEELLLLPCHHHFHSACIIKWLRINAICPLCKFNILKGNDNV